LLIAGCRFTNTGPTWSFYIPSGKIYDIVTAGAPYFPKATLLLAVQAVIDAKRPSIHNKMLIEQLLVWW
jgi:hypothetical protein